MLFTQMLFAQMLQHNVVKSQNVIISVRHIASITQAAAVINRVFEWEVYPDDFAVYPLDGDYTDQCSVRCGYSNRINGQQVSFEPTRWSMQTSGSIWNYYNAYKVGSDIIEIDYQWDGEDHWETSMQGVIRLTSLDVPTYTLEVKVHF